MRFGTRSKARIVSCNHDQRHTFGGILKDVSLSGFSGAIASRHLEEAVDFLLDGWGDRSAKRYKDPNYTPPQDYNVIGIPV